MVNEKANMNDLIEELRSCIETRYLSDYGFQTGYLTGLLAQLAQDYPEVEKAIRARIEFLKAA